MSPVELAAPAAGRIGGLLGVALVGIAAVERRRLDTLTGGPLFLRWRSWVLAVPVVGVAVASRWGALVAVSALAVQGSREYAAMTGLPAVWRRGLMAAGAGTAVVAVWSPALWWALPPVAALGATLVPLATQDVGSGVRRLAAGVLGYLWLGWLGAAALVLRVHVDGGAGVLLVLCVAVAAADVGAFVVGRVAGGPLLAPTVSPAKTWAGAVGTLAGATLGVALMSFALPDLPVGVRVALPAVIAAGCVWGDLLESLVKRHAGVKDTGTWLPGFGGLLDRVDSLLVAAPLVAALVVVAG